MEPIKVLNGKNIHNFVFYNLNQIQIVERRKAFNINGELKIPLL